MSTITCNRPWRVRPLEPGKGEYRSAETGRRVWLALERTALVTAHVDALSERRRAWVGVAGFTRI